MRGVSQMAHSRHNQETRSSGQRQPPGTRTSNFHQQ